MRYYTKPRSVEAFRWSGNEEKLLEWFLAQPGHERSSIQTEVTYTTVDLADGGTQKVPSDYKVRVLVREGPFRHVQYSDWIVRDLATNEFSVMTDEDFTKTYEATQPSLEFKP